MKSVSLGNVLVTGGTKGALKVQMDDLSTRWIPRSVVDEDSDVTPDAQSGEDGDLCVAQWWAEKEGLA